MIGFPTIPTRVQAMKAAPHTQAGVVLYLLAAVVLIQGCSLKEADADLDKIIHLNVARYEAGTVCVGFELNGKNLKRAADRKMHGGEWYPMGDGQERDRLDGYSAWVRMLYPDDPKQKRFFFGGTTVELPPGITGVKSCLAD